MKKLICIFMLFLATARSDAQNLVLNGDFEIYSSCPVALSMIDSATFWSNATNNGTPDYFHYCGNPLFAGVPQNAIGYQSPYTGEGYAGLYLWQGGNNYREFMIGQLSSSLVTGTCYHFEMFISLANRVKHTASNIAVYFSDTIITGITGLQMQTFTPQIANPPGNYPDTATWIPVSGNFTANGGENYLIIGNFDVDAALDTILVSPMALWPGTHVYVDAVSLTICTGIEESSPVGIHVFPNPVSDVLHIETCQGIPSECILYNSSLQKIYQQRYTGNTSVNMNKFSPGIYFYEIRSEKNNVVRGKVIRL